MTASLTHKIYALVDQCLQMGADPIGWRRQLCAGLADIFDASIVMTGESRNVFAASAEILLWVDYGWASDAQKSHFIRYQIDGANRSDPLRAHIDALNQSELVVSAIHALGRDELIASSVYRNYFSASGLEDQLVGICPIVSAPADRSTVIACHRAIGQPAFSRRDRQTMALLLKLIGPMVGSRLADSTDPVARLTPKQRQALAELLLGHSERECAAAMGISPRTFHKYVTELYTLFDVKSRAALQARFLGRGALTDPDEVMFEPRNNRIRRSGVPMAKPWEKRSRFERTS